MKVVNVSFVNGRLMPNFIGFTVAHTALDPTTGQPISQRMWIVIATRFF